MSNLEITREMKIDIPKPDMDIVGTVTCKVICPLLVIDRGTNGYILRFGCKLHLDKIVNGTMCCPGENCVWGTK